MSEICSQGQRVQISGSSIWPISSPENLYKARRVSNISSTTAGHSHSKLPRHSNFLGLTLGTLEKPQCIEM